MRFPCVFICCRPISCYQGARVIQQHESSIQKKHRDCCFPFYYSLCLAQVSPPRSTPQNWDVPGKVIISRSFFPTELVVKLWTVWLSLFFILMSASSNQILLHVSLSPYFYVLFSILAFCLMGAMNGKIYFSTVLLPIGIKLLVWLFL